MTPEETRKQLKETFIEFLKDNDMYDEYTRRFAHEHHSNFELNNWLDKANPFAWLSGAFVWPNNYWGDLSTMWNKIIKSNVD